MTTTPVDRDVIRAWRDNHTNVQAAHNGERCIHSVWVDDIWAGRCGRSATWIVDYSHRARSLGRRPHCEAHTVSVLSKWLKFENGEVPA